MKENEIKWRYYNLLLLNRQIQGDFENSIEIQKRLMDDNVKLRNENTDLRDMKGVPRNYFKTNCL